MDIFLSWSGDRSRDMATILKKWLKKVLQATSPFVSPDTEKGARWSPELAHRLESTQYGILCLTRENLESTWLHYEAGAIAKWREGRAATVLLDIDPTDVKPPLGDFQATKIEREDFFRLIGNINEKLAHSEARSLDAETLNGTFHQFWPELEKELTELQSKIGNDSPPIRKDRDLLEELITYARTSEYRTSQFELSTQILSRQDLQHLVQLASGKPYDPIGLIILAGVLPPSFAWLAQMSRDLYLKLEAGSPVEARDELMRLKYLVDTSTRLLWNVPARSEALAYFSDYILHLARSLEKDE